MTQPSALELQGDLNLHPFAELFVEISQARLSGSLRVSSQERKAIVYFDEGLFAFAVSNERRFRLAEVLSTQGAAVAGTLEQPKGMSDLQWADKLVESGRLVRQQITDILAFQSRSIVDSILEWEGGEWTFSPLARLREGVFYGFDAGTTLINYARGLAPEAAAGRFRTSQEVFSQLADIDLTLDLLPQEAYILSRFDRSRFTLADIVALSGLSEQDTKHAVYSLWLGGLLLRHNWNPAFTEFKISAIRVAELSRKTQPIAAQPQRPATQEKAKPAKAAVEEPEFEFVEISVDEYLARVEKAESLYDVLGVADNSKAATIRHSYFNLAKRFHPDRFHKAEPELRRRIENAFTQIAQAHESLRLPDSRKNYDIKLQQERKDRELVKAAVAAGEEASRPVQESQASGDFERGFALQLRGDFEAALPYLARAVYYSPKNARYRAFYGKALSYDENQKHKAEQELQAAIRHEPDNPAYRVMLAEFFVRVKLLKRAEGELKRLLVTFPNNQEARSLLDSLRAK